jgi:hypothetical protein
MSYTKEVLKKQSLKKLLKQKRKKLKAIRVTIGIQFLGAPHWEQSRV